MSPQSTPNVAPRAAQLATDPPSAGNAQLVTRISGDALGAPVVGSGFWMVTVAPVTSHGAGAPTLIPFVTAMVYVTVSPGWATPGDRPMLRVIPLSLQPAGLVKFADVAMTPTNIDVASSPAVAS